MPLPIPPPSSCSPRPSKLLPDSNRFQPVSNLLGRLLADLPQIASADKIRDTVVSQLSKCLFDTYIVVTQPGAHAEDYSDRYAAPHLRRHISGEDERSRSSATVPDVLGDIDADGIVQEVERTCEAALLKVDASS